MSSLARSTISSRVFAWLSGSVDRCRAIGDGVVAEALGSGDRAALHLDLLELVDADLVQILRIERERRPRQDLGAIERVALGRRPEAGLLAAGVPVLAAQLVEERLVGGIDHLADDPLDLGALLVGRDLGVRDHDRLLGRDSEDALELRDRPLGDDARCRQAAPEPLAQELPIRGHVALVVAQPGSELLEPLGRVGLLERR